MSLQVSRVWLVREDGQELQVPTDKVLAGDRVRIHMGNVIPFDGEVTEGEAMVNQASLTGEASLSGNVPEPLFTREPCWRKGN